MNIYQPRVAGQIKVVISDVGNVGNSLRGSLEVAASFSISEHLTFPFVKTYSVLIKVNIFSSERPFG